MKLGMVIRVMGPQSSRDTIVACARAAEQAELDEVWIVDHIAIPPDDAEGSGGRYLDPLATLAYLAAVTERVRIGTSVLVLPYRPALPTAKALATVQELSGGRLQLGVGVGWMEQEFRALGVERRRRGALTDAALDFFDRAFASDEVEENGQRFLFLPRPVRPPIYVGGSPPHAFERIRRHGDGWMPMVRSPEQLAPRVAQLRALLADAGRPEPEVVVLTGLDLDDPARASAQARAWAEAGATHLAHGSRYADSGEFQKRAGTLASLRTSL